MTTYLLNSPALTAYGQYEFSGPLTVDAARELLAGGFVSAIGHEGAAVFLSNLLSVDVPTHRIRITMQLGDRALVLRLLERLPEGRTLSAEETRAFPFELGVLHRIV